MKWYYTFIFGFVIAILIFFFFFIPVPDPCVSTPAPVPTSTPIPIPTSWSQGNVLVEINGHELMVWTDNADMDKEVIDKLREVYHTTVGGNGHYIMVRVDRRYTQEATAKKILQALFSDEARPIR